MIAFKAIPHKAISTASYYLHKNSIVMNWPSGGDVSHNWGDKLNPYLVSKLTGATAYTERSIYPFTSCDIHYWIGSHLNGACSNSRAVIYGAGLINSKIQLKASPRKVCAVRGWDSYEILTKAGIECPEVVGDAALLLPLVYRPSQLEKKTLGIVAHYAERDLSFFQNVKRWSGCRFIDITGTIEGVIDQITSCDYIFSSSLHGLICSDAYNIPSTWIHASDRLLGDGFKFCDYFTSVGRQERAPVKVDSYTTRSTLEKHMDASSIKLDTRKLLNACPLSLSHKVHHDL